MAHILIIDDDYAIRELLKEALKADGNEISDAVNGKEGVKTIRRQTTDLVITDIFMPEQEGVETIQEIRAMWPSIPIIAISGGGQYQQHSMMTLCKKIGADKVIQKPFDLADFREEVRNMLEDINEG